MNDPLFKHGKGWIHYANRIDAEYLSSRLRESDREEIWLSHKQKPKQSLLIGLETSLICFTGFYRFHPFFMAGIVTDLQQPNTGLIWLLGTDRIRTCPKTFYGLTYQLLHYFFWIYPTLYNYVYEHNSQTLNWLAHLGAEFSESFPHGEQKKPFRKFTLKQGEVPHV